MAHFIEMWASQNPDRDIDMRSVAQLAMANGFRAPKAPTELDLLAKEFSHAAREQTRNDDETGRPYRVYHAFKHSQGGQQLTLWVDIDKAPRKKMVLSLQMRREQMVGDAVAVTYDADHWNRIHPDEEQIQIALDFAPDVEWRKNAPDTEDEKEAS